MFSLYLWARQRRAARNQCHLVSLPCLGDIEGSYEAQESVTGLRTDLYKVAFSPAAVKKALQLMGHDVGDSRYAVNFTPEQISEIQQIIRHYNIN
ncbi:hypothetical protein EIMP300_70340 [Escherichia coli]|uniref:Uncharacterized protein n=1 Tax=Escherichia coli TaxID=562 RepID=A0A8S0FYP8_ECOLX|nr:hypothetical protein EIMP300_70340 [Escherichia coli]